MQKLKQLSNGKWQWENEEFDTKQEAIAYGQYLQHLRNLAELQELKRQKINLLREFQILTKNDS